MLANGECQTSKCICVCSSGVLIPEHKIGVIEQFKCGVPMGHLLVGI